MNLITQFHMCIFLAVLVIHTKAKAENLDDAEKKPVRTKVLILGAGVSGISAASTLYQQNHEDVVILEAQEHIGGRVKAVEWEGFTVEAGANWIHHVNDVDSRPLVELKRMVDLTGRMSNYSDMHIRSNGQCFHPQHDVIKKFRDIFLPLKSADQDDCCVDSFRQELERHNWTSLSALHDVIEYFDVDFECARPPDTVSFYALDAREHDFFVSDSRGLSSLYKPLYKTFANRILLGEVATSIEYNNDSVFVETSSGNSYIADYAICTFSSDVILSDVTPIFKPRIPRWKREAYGRAPMGLYTKIFVKFPHQFWEDNEYILHVSSQRGYYPVIQNFGVYRPEGHGVLLITVTGSEALRIENQANTETLQEVTTMLRGLYGEEIPEPLDIYYERWSQNPFTRGAYSEPVLGTIPRDFDDMRRNVGRLYFAGEATSEDWYGYMQGAYITGKQSAMEIVQDMKRAGRL